MKAPLAGLRVIALEQFGAGPYGSMYMADLGAEVIKLENRAVGGDASRQGGPYYLGENDSQYFQTFNLNKRSITVDLKKPRGQEILHKLAATSDVIWNNLRGDQPAKLGIDYESLSSVNPKIVCTHLSAYGRDNDRENWPGYDFLMQSECGFLSVTGEPGTPPARFGLSMVDFMSGTVAGMATLAAWIGATRTGKGGNVDVNLFDVALHQLSYPGTWYLNEGVVTGRLPRGSHPSQTPVQLYPTEDGWIFIMCMTQRFWEALARNLERDDLCSDERFADSAARVAHRDALTEVLDAEFRKRTTAQWLELLRGKLPVGPVYDIAQALDNPFVAETGMVQEIAHPEQDLRILSNPVRLDGERLPGRPAASLGADNEDILAELGFADELESLRRDGVI